MMKREQDQEQEQEKETEKEQENGQGHGQLQIVARLRKWACDRLERNLGVRTRVERCQVRVKEQQEGAKHDCQPPHAHSKRETTTFVVEHVFRSVYVGPSAVQTSTIPYTVRCLECERRLRDAHWPVLFAVDLEIARCGERRRVAVYAGAQCLECCGQKHGEATVPETETVSRVARATMPFLLLQRWAANAGVLGDIDAIDEQHWASYAKELVEQRSCRMCHGRVARKKCKWRAVVHVAPDAQTVVVFPVLYCCDACKRSYEWMERMKGGEQWYNEDEEALAQRGAQQWWSDRQCKGGVERTGTGAGQRTAASNATAGRARRGEAEAEAEAASAAVWTPLAPWHRFLLPRSARYNVPTWEE